MIPYHPPAGFLMWALHDRPNGTIRVRRVTAMGQDDVSTVYCSDTMPPYERPIDRTHLFDSERAATRSAIALMKDRLRTATNRKELLTQKINMLQEEIDHLTNRTDLTKERTK